MLTDSKGLVPVTATYTANVPLVVNTVKKTDGSTNLNPHGGEVVEIEGNNFPGKKNEGTEVLVSF